MNKKEKKMIEDMARVLCGRTNKCHECVMPLTPICGYKSYCEILHNANYRKVAEDEIVLKKSEYENLRLAQYNAQNTINEIFLLALEKIEQAKKETVKEFAKIVISAIWEEKKNEKIKIKDVHDTIRDILRMNFDIDLEEEENE